MTRPSVKVSILVGVLVFSTLSASVRATEPFPYEMKSGTETGLVLAAAACYGAGWWLDRDCRPLTPTEIDALNPGTLNFLDRSATRNWSPGADRASNYLVTGQLILPLGLAFGETGSQQPLKVTAMYLETMALNSGMTYLLKNLFQRSRPFVYSDNPEIDPALKTSTGARKSFPSGHTANAFAAMVFLAGVYEQFNPDDSGTGLVWGACLTSAAVTGILRVGGGRHFPTDVLAGAVLGSVVGWAVPRLHEIDRPDAGGNPGPGISLSYGFVF